MSESPSDEYAIFENRQEAVVLFILMMIASFFSLFALGDHYLWQDEAQTALLARTILDHGFPLGLDGENHLSQELGAEYGDGYIWCWHTWLPFYLLAAFFSVFGESTFIARLPFVLFGIATIPATYAIAKELWRDRVASTASVVVLMLCVAYLILIRQCRWYSPAAFFSATAILGYLWAMRSRDWGSELMVASLLCLFHTHYFYVVTLTVAIFLHCLIWNREHIKRLSLSIGVLVVLCSPWIVWLSGIRYDEPYGDRVFGFKRSIEMCTRFLIDVEKHMLPWFILEIPLVACFVQMLRKQEEIIFDREMWSAITLLIFTCGSTICALSLAAPEGYFRYLAPILPCIAVLIGGIVKSAASIHWSLGFATMLVTISQYPLADYAYELTHDFDGPIEGIVKYLQKNAEPDDVVGILYGDMPLKFYTDLRIVGGLTGEDMSPVRNADWIIMRKDWRGIGKVRNVTQALTSELERGNYEKIVIDYPDTPFENREDPNEHLFRTSGISDRVTIWRRVRESQTKDSVSD